MLLHVTLLLEQALVKLEGWEDTVTIVSCDMRHWNAAEKADILVYFECLLLNRLTFIVHIPVSDCSCFEFRLVNC